MTQLTFTIASKEQAEAIKHNFNEVNRLTKGEDPLGTVVSIMNKGLDTLNYLVLEGRTGNSTGYFDPLASLELPGEINTRYVAWCNDSKRRIVIQKGRGENNIVVFDRYTFNKDEGRVVTFNAGDAYAPFLHQRALKDAFEVSDTLSIVDKVEEALDTLGLVS